MARFQSSFYLRWITWLGWISKKVLFTAIKKGGSSIRDFKNTSGKQGKFQKNFNVYGREGLVCKRLKCQGIIKKKNFLSINTIFWQ